MTEDLYSVPPFDLTEGILARVAEICEALEEITPQVTPQVGRLPALPDGELR